MWREEMRGEERRIGVLCVCVGGGLRSYIGSTFLMRVIDDVVWKTDWGAGFGVGLV